MTNSVVRARADLDAGRLWKARDRLNGVLAANQQVDVLDLLATVHFAMGDLPAAGALWFVTGRDDEAVRDSLAAWRERYGSDQARWNSIPGPVRRNVSGQHLRSLERDALGTPSGRTHATELGDQTGAWWEAILFGGGAIVCILWLATMIGIGMWTVVRWIWT